ncbi:MAG: tyrosine-type recombinase/integrase [Lachnospiraceae bacterium]|nr:tyrosine-type recombinase/integrase [Lachnospiraceae bacterium]
MREELITRIINILSKYDIPAQDLRLDLDIALADFEITSRCTELMIADEDVNEAMLRRFLAAKLASGRTERTLEYYRNTMRAFFRKVEKNFDQITSDDIRLYIALRIKKDGVSKVTANNERRNVSAFYQWLQKEEILLRNPMSKVEGIKLQKAKKKAFEEIEMEKIRDACRTNRERAIIEVLSSTWCRVSEVAQIKLSEINDDEILVHGKGEKDRIVYLNAKAKLALEKYLSERKDDNPYLFARARYAGNVATMSKNRKRKDQCKWYLDPELVDGDKNMEKSTIESVVRKIGRRAGVENVHPHRFRRTGATYALARGMPLITVSKLLGHADIGVTQVYLDISDKDLEEAHRKYVR